MTWIFLRLPQCSDASHGPLRAGTSRARWPHLSFSLPDSLRPVRFSRAHSNCIRRDALGLAAAQVGRGPINSNSEVGRVL